ncbi:non-homologous end-joining DNA ligase [Miltoncostaea marina]|uniref:non-homologous end-joining DNA ligase n=1 Tax=Miltoncostaea marina TaxID=2843215 RepID=UPI001C3D1272|nr:non-homologous end-joining DNA ligase [Miltoncostaea marina]
MSPPGARAVRAGRRSVPISNADRVLFPDAGLTKLDLARHYARVAPAMLPHVRGRPLALHSFPGGIAGDGFFLKDAPRHFPRWIATVAVPKREGGTIRHVVARDAATLVYLAGQNVITPHAWTSRADRLEVPDRLVIDLDPTVQRFAEVRAAARAVGDLMRDAGLAPFAMTTGSRGLHVVAPLRRSARFDEVHALARALGEAAVALDPARLTTAFRRAERGERIYVDVGRNRYGQHAVAPYAVRPLPGAPVATPLRWEELDDPALGPRSWTIATIGARLDEGGDPWRGSGRHARAAGPALRRLGAGGR